MHLFDLTGKTALITGASGGLGQQFARCLSNAGARVLLTARRFGEIQALANELGNARALAIDVSDRVSIKSAFEQFSATDEQIHICINNAGIGKTTPIFDSAENDNFENILQTNVIGVWYLTRAVANHMKGNGIRGSIINIGSINGSGAYPGKMATGYNVSKAAVLHMTRSLVAELAPHGIRINSISPGYFPTQQDEENRDFIRKKIPLDFIPKLNDLDGLILYLASDYASRYVTGSCFTIDGGMSYAEK
ncbi:MAG: 3-ketoacyl-ACP reductase [Verrucomicrobia bacterium]|nr:MAG: 3-ketoacyl-ACP reductase [Verrucomicrobiota bacterium]